MGRPFRTLFIHVSRFHGVGDDNAVTPSFMNNWKFPPQDLVRHPGTGHARRPGVLVFVGACGATSLWIS